MTAPGSVAAMGDADRDGVALHVDVHDGDGPPMLFVHGMMAGRALWAANIEPLREVVTPVVVELYGHGRSPSPEDPAAYHPSTYAALFDAIRGSLGAERWFVAGHSLGAALALNHVLDHPHRILGTVFTNSASALADDEWRANVAATIDKAADHIEQGGPEAVAAHRLNPARSWKLVPEVRDALAADVPLLDPAGLARTMRHTTIPASVRERAGANPAPCLVIHGEQEKSFAEPASYAATAMPHTEVRVVNAGHSPNGEVPDQYNALVRDFVRRVLSTNG